MQRTIILFYIVALATCQSICGENRVVIDSQCVQNDIATLEGARHIQLMIRESGDNYEIDYSTSEQGMAVLIKTNSQHAFALIYESESLHEIWLLQIHSDIAQVSASDCYIQKRSGALLDTSIDGISKSLKLVGYSLAEGTTKIKLTRPIDQSEFNLTLINQPRIERYDLLAISEEAADEKEHQFPHDQIVVNKAPLFPEHLGLNLVAWGILADIPIIIARYCKTYKWYVVAHEMLFNIVSLLSTIAQIAIIIQKRFDYRFDNFKEMALERKMHMIFGTTFFFINFFQLVQGYMLKYIIYNKNTRWANYFTVSKEVHHLTGYVLYFFAKFLLLNGFWIAFFNHFSWEAIAMMVLLTFTALWRAVLEFIFRKQMDFIYRVLKLKTPTPMESFEANVSVSFDTKLVSHMELAEFDNIMKEYPNKKWCIFNNSVIDLTDLIHPGGNFIWEECQGREVARFIYGAFGLESTTMMAWNHTDYSLKLLEKYTIDSLLTIPLFSDDQSRPQTWHIVGIKQLNAYNKLFEFSKQGVTFQTTLNGIEHFGRYFLLRSATDQNIACRPYTLLLCMARCNQLYRQYVIQYCAEKLNLPEIATRERMDKPVYSFQATEFPLIIKNYPSKNGFSQYVHSLSIGDKITMSGPFVHDTISTQGTAFGINHQEAGTIVLITGGTGVLPFLDLIEFLFKKTIYNLLRQKSKKEADEINPSNINFDRYFKPTFKMVFLLAVQAKEDLIGRDIYFTLARIQKLLPQPNFEMILTMTEKFDEVIPGVNYVGKQRFDNAFFEKHVPNVRQVSRFILCGPPTMVRLVPAGLNEMGITNDKIYLV